MKFDPTAEGNELAGSGVLQAITIDDSVPILCIQKNSFRRGYRYVQLSPDTQCAVLCVILRGGGRLSRPTCTVRARFGIGYQYQAAFTRWYQ